MEISSGNTPFGRHKPNGFPASLRVKSRDDFAKVFGKGKVASDETLVIHAVRAVEKPTRLGLSISKKVGCAPVRNHWKRLIREAFRTQHTQFPTGLTLVARPRKGAVASLPAIRRSLTRLVRKLDDKV